jgi:hypothetical protein
MPLAGMTTLWSPPATNTKRRQVMVAVVLPPPPGQPCPNYARMLSQVPPPAPLSHAHPLLQRPRLCRTNPAAALFCPGRPFFPDPADSTALPRPPKNCPVRLALIFSPVPVAKPRAPTSPSPERPIGPLPYSLSP